jgi:hypothetical protein
MRRASILPLLLVAALSAATVVPFCGSAPSRPACCNKHGCTMARRAATDCAFSTCDQRESGMISVKTFLAIAAGRNLARFAQSESRVVPAAVAASLPPFLADIDHPPRLLSS